MMILEDFIILRQVFCSIIGAIVLLLCSGAQAQGNSVPPPSAEPTYSATELDKLTTPIALYSDFIIDIVLPASVFPLEIGDAAFQLAQENVTLDIPAQAWDPSVKSLAQFPLLVQWMDRNLPWTTDLGRAVVAQHENVTDSIQRVRAKNYAAGTLKSDAYNSVAKYISSTGKEIITISPVIQPAGAAVSTGITSTPSTPPTMIVPVAPAYAGSPAPPPPTSYSSIPSPSSGGGKAGAVVGVTALAIVANNVDRDEKHVIQTPGGIVVVDEDDLEDVRRPSNQPMATSTSSSGSSTHSAAQTSSAEQSAASRGWSQPRSSPSAASSTGGFRRSGPSEGARARAYSGRGTASRQKARSSR